MNRLRIWQADEPSPAASAISAEPGDFVAIPSFPEPAIPSESAVDSKRSGSAQKMVSDVLRTTRDHSVAIARQAQQANARVQTIATTAATSGGQYAKQVGFGVFDAVRKWHDDGAGPMAASVAYYLALSLFPMLLLLTAGLGLVFRYTRVGHDAEVQILAIVAEHCSPTLEQQVREVLSQLRVHSLVGGPFGLVTAILAAIGVFYQFERAFDRIWKTPPPRDKHWTHACVRIVKQRLSAFLLLASVGCAVMLIMLANVAIGLFHTWMIHLHLPGTAAVALVEASMTLILNGAVFGLLYRFLPKRRIHWMDAMRGGLLASIVWEGGRQLLGAIVIGVRYTAAYGAIGSFIALLLWCYWGVSIIFLGAEYAQILCERRKLLAKSKLSTEETSTQATEPVTQSISPAVTPMSPVVPELSVSGTPSSYAQNTQPVVRPRPTVPRRVAA